MALVDCEACAGDGVVMDDDGEDDICPECNGEGMIEDEDEP